MYRKELYLRLEDIQHDFNILKNRIDSYLEEQEEVIGKLNDVNKESYAPTDKRIGEYVLFTTKDIVQNTKIIESELYFVQNNKEDILRLELSEHLDGLEEKIKLMSNKFKQLNLDIKEAFYFEAISGRSKH